MCSVIPQSKINITAQRNFRKCSKCLLQVLNLSNASMASLKTLEELRTSKEHVEQKQMMTLLMLYAPRFNKTQENLLAEHLQS